MDLIGLPWRITVGPRGLKNGVVELTSRRTGESEEMSLEDVEQYLNLPVIGMIPKIRSNPLNRSQSERFVLSEPRSPFAEAINDIDWGDKTLSVRINGLDTHYMYRDVVDVIELEPKKPKASLRVRLLGEGAGVTRAGFAFTEPTEILTRLPVSTSNQGCRKLEIPSQVFDAVPVAHVQPAAQHHQRRAAAHFTASSNSCSVAALNGRSVA